MRIVSGKYRGKKLLSPIDEKTRPTSDKVKEALFNILGMKVQGATCLDLFSGSGALGIECISRGAQKVIFNDLNKNAIKVIKDNLSSLKNIDCEYQVFNKDYQILLENLKEKFDIVFLDPPYAMKINEKIITILKEKELLNDDCVIVVETSSEDSLENLQCSYEKSYKYGSIMLTIVKI